MAQRTQEVKTPIATLLTIYYIPEEWQNRESVMLLLLAFFIDMYGGIGSIKGGRIMSIPIRMGRTEIGTIYLLAMVFLAAVLAILGVVYNDAWAKGGVVAAVGISILLYWSITKEKKTLTP